MVILNHDCDITRLLYLQLKILDVPHLDFVIFAAAEMSFNQASEWKNLTWARFENHKSSLCAQSIALHRHRKSLKVSKREHLFAPIE